MQTGCLICTPTYLWNHVLWQVVKSVTTVAKLMGLLAPVKHIQHNDSRLRTQHLCYCALLLQGC
jgi:hypothetical protein